MTNSLASRAFPSNTARSSVSNDANFNANKSRRHTVLFVLNLRRMPTVLPFKLDRK